MTTFNPNFPVDGFPLDNFSPFVQNFNSINTTFAKDHTLFSDPTDTTAGHHKHVRFYDVQPVPTLTNPQCQLYSKDQNVSPAVPGGVDVYRSLFFAQKPNTGAQIERQLTDLGYVSGTSTVTGTTLSWRSYDTPWGWRILVADLQAFAPVMLGKTFTITVPFLTHILYSGANSVSAGGSIASYNVSPASALSTISIFPSDAVPAKVIVISTNV